MSFTFLFPGQGAQKVGMGADFFNRFEFAKKRFEKAGELLGRDLAALCFEGPQQQLTETQNTQPALFVVESVISDVLIEHGLSPVVALGHSLGEYSALYAAGVFSFEDGLQMVAKRGELMAQAGQKAPGSMAAVVGLDKEKIAQALEDVRGIVVPANENSPDQTVISGAVEAVAAAGEKLQAAGAKRVIPLSVSGAFHSPLMQEAADEFAKVLDGVAFSDARCPVITNVTADAQTSGSELKKLLIKQLVSPVRWVDSMRVAASHAQGRCLEVGPGNVLRGLARKIDRSINVVSCESVDNVYSVVNSTKSQQGEQA
ncbi:MAG: ACP S-malonyltransferase [Chitinivibrionales bacterium]